MALLFSENALFINMRLTISETAMKHCVRQNNFGTSQKKVLLL